jgi:hypothetical protein
VGFLKDQAIRLLRESWSRPKELAEELFAIFDSDTPFTIDGPLTINNTSPTEPAIRIRQFGDSPINIVIQRPEVPGAFPGGPDPVDDPVEEEVAPDSGSAPGGQQDEEESGGSSGPGGIYGVVQSGSGSSYQVLIYEDGPSAAATRTVTVTQVQIDASAEIPADSGVVVFEQPAGTYWMQAPVWM